MSSWFARVSYTSLNQGWKPTSSLGGSSCPHAPSATIKISITQSPIWQSPSFHSHSTLSRKYRNMISRIRTTNGRKKESFTTLCLRWYSNKITRTYSFSANSRSMVSQITPLRCCLSRPQDVKLSNQTKGGHLWALRKSSKALLARNKILYFLKFLLQDKALQIH